MADRDRGRPSSSYKPRDRERDERDRDQRSWKMYNDTLPQRAPPSPTEPGQITSLPRRPTREWEVERDPRVPPTVGSAGGGGDAGPSRRRVRSRSRGSSRSRSRTPEYSSKEIADALGSFSRSMHSTLLATTTQALAARHVERLEAFPQNLVNYETLTSARDRLREADTELNDMMRSLQTAFADVMRRATPSFRAGQGGRRDSRVAEDRQEMQRMIRDKVDFSELVSVRKRLEGVERQLEEGVELRADKGKGKEKEPSPPPIPVNITAVPGDDGTDPSTKRTRARELLEDMLKRLEKVEGMKEYLENRYFDIQDQLNAKEQEELEILRLGNGRWKIIEELRDPDGVIRGLKRRKIDKDEDTEEVPMELDPDSQQGGPIRSESRPKASDSAPAALPADSVVQALRTQVETLQKEIAEIKAGQETREKAIVDQVTATIQSQLDGMVRSRIMKAVDVVKAQGSLAAKATQRSSTSPATANSPFLPTTTQKTAQPSPNQAVVTLNDPASRRAPSSGPAQVPQPARSTSNTHPQPRSANASPLIPQQQQPQASPGIPAQSAPRSTSQPVAPVTSNQQAGQARSQLNIALPPNTGWSVTPPQPPQSAPPTINPLHRLIDPRLQSNAPSQNQQHQPQGLGIQPGPPLPPNQAQLQAFQALVNNGQNGQYRPQQNNSGNESLVQKVTNVLGAQNQQGQQSHGGGYDGLEAWVNAQQK